MRSANATWETCTPYRLCVTTAQTSSVTVTAEQATVILCEAARYSAGRKTGVYGEISASAFAALPALTTDQRARLAEAVAEVAPRAHDSEETERWAVLSMALAAGFDSPDEPGEVSWYGRFGFYVANAALRFGMSYEMEQAQIVADAVLAASRQVSSADRSISARDIRSNLEGLERVGVSIDGVSIETAPIWTKLEQDLHELGVQQWLL